LLPNFMCLILQAWSQEFTSVRSPRYKHHA
jgi:hypothetical protein